MKTINIKGKEYVPVVERVKEFHNLYPDGTITTEIVSSDEQRVVVKATIKLESKMSFRSAGTNEITPLSTVSRIFTGHSQAEWGKGMMGGVSLEVAETSAIGRALGFANIGLLDGIASADEMRKVKKTDDADDSVPF